MIIIECIGSPVSALSSNFRHIKLLNISREAQRKVWLPSVACVTA
jgi:hypothetical protein